MPTTAYTLFVSSPQRELAVERRAIRDFVEADPLLGRFFRVFLFEDLPASDRRPDQAYLQHVESAAVYVGVFGQEYGAFDAEGISPTEREFDRATALGRERLIFVKGADPGRDPRMAALIGKAGSQLIRRRFTDVSQLTAGLYASLVEFLERQGDIRSLPFDAAACPQATLDDLSEEALDDFLARARKNRGYAIGAGTPMRSALAHLNLLEAERPSHAAVLLFGKTPQRFLPTSEVKCLHFHGTEIRKPIPSHQVYKGTVFSLVDQALDFVMSKVNRRVGTRAGGAQAPVEYEIPRDAVAEAIVNAVVHRDYASNASVQVMLFADRLEVWNPGGLIPPLTFASLRVPHPSIPRNPLLAEPMFLARYIERAGTGTLDMAALSRDAGLKEPQFRFEHGQFIQVLWRPAGETRQVTPQVTPQVESLLKVMTREHTREQLQDLLQLSDRENFRLGYLVPALDAGLVERTIADRPQSRSQRYRLTPAGQAVHQRLLRSKPDAAP